jgi:phage N-6-adenine-methyltransferase
MPRRRIYRTNAERQAAYRRRKRRPAYLRSTNTEWETPADLYHTLHAEFRFTLDVAAVPDNAKCARFYTPADDGLTQPWVGTCWCNPPYGRQVGQWIRKAYESAQAGATVVCLVPARVDTRWWHDYVLPASEVRYLRGRLKFGASRHNATFPSVLCIFRPPGGTQTLHQEEIVGWRAS